MDSLYTYLLVVIGLVLIVMGLSFAAYKLVVFMRSRGSVFRITDLGREVGERDPASQRKYQVNSSISDDFRLEISDVQLMSQVSCGTYGEVYEGYWQGTSIAVKKLFHRERFKGETLKKFERETILMGKLRHPNVILFIGVVINAENLWIITEFMGKGSLHDVIHDPNQELSWRLVIAMAMDAARGMQYLHHFKPPIVHCDLKSKNILVGNQYNAKVCDFGTSKFKTEEQKPNITVGTIQWTAPEIIRDEKHTEKADIYSFGIILWELISRSTPYKDLNHLEIAIAVAYDCPPKRPPLFPNCPIEYTDIIENCWAADPSSRPSFDQILKNLKDAFHKCDEFPPHPFSDLLNEELTIPNIMISIPGRHEKKHYRDQKLHIGLGFPDNEREMYLDSTDARLHRGSKTLISELETTHQGRQYSNPGSSCSSNSQDIDYPTHRVRSAPTKNHWEISYDDIQILAQVGNGSFGVVSKGVWRDTEVAVKVLSNQNQVAKRLEDFKGEVSMMCELRHPNVVLFMASCLEPPHVCLVTEFMPRGNLYHVLHNQDLTMDWIRILSMATDAARGMNYLHCWNPPIIHRDLKSSNLLVDENWVVKVSDFGMSRFKVEDATMSQVGTMKWTAPEILRGERYNEKVDIYSFGIILWEMLTREEPHANMNGMKVGMEVMKNQIRPLIPENCPEAYSSLIQNCWDEDPDLRPSFAIILHRLKSIETNTIALKQAADSQDSLTRSGSPSVVSVKSKRQSSMRAVSFAESQSSKGRPDSTPKKSTRGSHKHPGSVSSYLKSMPSSNSVAPEATPSVGTHSARDDNDS